MGIDKFSQLLSDLDDNNWNVICKQGTDKYITGRMRNVYLQYLKDVVNVNIFFGLANDLDLIFILIYCLSSYERDILHFSI